MWRKNLSWSCLIQTNKLKRQECQQTKACDTLMSVMNNQSIGSFDAYDGIMFLYLLSVLYTVVQCDHNVRYIPESRNNWKYTNPLYKIAFFSYVYKLSSSLPFGWQFHTIIF